MSSEPPLRSVESPPPLVERLTLADWERAVRGDEAARQARVRRLLGRVAHVDPVVRALVPEPGRDGRVLWELRQVCERFPSAVDRPALFAVPVVVKDVFAVAGLPTRAGSILPPGLFERPEAALVRALRRAGALVLGKGVTTEFAMLDPAATRNPHALEHTPGGSSSGPAAAVAAGFAPLAIGTQTTGSTVRPAAYCGVVGFKPSYARVPTGGMLFCAPSVDTVGLFANAVPDLERLCAQVFLRWDARAAERLEEHPSWSAARLGVPRGALLARLDAQGRPTFEANLERLRAAGHALIDVPEPFDLARECRLHQRLAAAEFARVHAAWYREHAERYGPYARGLVESGRAVPDAELPDLRANRFVLRRALESALDAHSLDAFVAPPADGPAPAGLEQTGDPTPALPWTHAGLPSLALPAKFHSEGLPAAVQLVGRFGADEALLALALRLEKDLA